MALNKMDWADMITPEALFYRLDRTFECLFSCISSGTRHAWVRFESPRQGVASDAPRNAFNGITNGGIELIGIC
jgi:hypothetical protein